jgi:hypothetical protein
LHPLLKGNDHPSCREDKLTLPRSVGLRPAEPNANARYSSGGGICGPEAYWLGNGDLGVPQGCDLAAPSPTGSERDQEDCTIAQVNGFESVTGGQGALKDIAGHQLAALALWLTGGSFHG